MCCGGHTDPDIPLFNFLVCFFLLPGRFETITRCRRVRVARAACGAAGRTAAQQHGGAHRHAAPRTRPPARSCVSGTDAARRQRADARPHGGGTAGHARPAHAVDADTHAIPLCLDFRLARPRPARHTRVTAVSSHWRRSPRVWTSNTATRAGQGTHGVRSPVRSCRCSIPGSHARPH